ncbi:NifU family protein [Anabaena catenula]|uniref:NifU family protein n=1 Tax=Anabaena catenula TaxID=1296320 RepID=UPI001F54DC96|nr:NifU family protein [Anabaena catenula]
MFLSNCLASTLTLSQGIEKAIKALCQEITTVIAVSSRRAYLPIYNLRINSN